jgi:hypothetical protein
VRVGTGARLLEDYGKKDIDSWGYEKRPREKVNKLKRI